MVEFPITKVGDDGVLVTSLEASPSEAMPWPDVPLSCDAAMPTCVTVAMVEPSTHVVRSLGAGVEVRVAAEDLVILALCTWVTVLLANMVRGLGVSVNVGTAASKIVVGCRLWLLG